MRRADREPEAKPQDEQSLVLRLKAGDEAAFAELVRENAGRLLAVARRMLRSEDDARDALQDAFLQAFRGIGRFQGEARLSTWLHRIVINTCLMKLRTRSRKPEGSIDELLPKFHSDGHRIDPGPAWRTANRTPSFPPTSPRSSSTPSSPPAAADAASAPDEGWRPGETG